ncbi:MAG: glycosyl hydrolase family 28-related protein [Burkholderia sp.]
MSAPLVPLGKAQWSDANGFPLVGGQVMFAIPGTSTPKNTWQDAAQTILNQNPITLDDRGEAIVFGSPGAYRQIVTDASGDLVYDVLTYCGLDSGAVSIGDTTLSDQLKSRLECVADSISALRAVSKSIYTRVFVTGYRGPHDGGGGSYQLDPSDTTSEDNGGTIIKAADGGIWKMSVTYSITVRQFGAVGDGTSDDSPPFQAAIDWMKSVGGGKVVIDPDGKFFLGAGVVVDAGVSLAGVVNVVGTIGDNTSAPYGEMGGALLLAANMTIDVYSSSGLSSALVYPKGMTFPQADASTWTGTAIRVMGDDASIEWNMVLGFGQAVSGGGVQRPYIGYCKFDCVNGVDLEQVLDVANIEKVHCWPFATVATTNKPVTWSDRNGAAFNLHDTVDWANVIDCFAYNYNYGAILNGVNQTSLVNFKTDGTFTVATGTGRVNTVGVLVEGTSQSTRILCPQINSCQFSVIVNLPEGSGYSVSIEGGSLNSSGNPLTGPFTGAGLLVQGGDVHVTARFHYHGNGIRVTNAASIITGNPHFEAVAQDVVCDVQTSNVFLQGATFGSGQVNGQQVVVGDLRAPTVSTASGGANLPMNAPLVFISGGDFGAVSGGYYGRSVVLVFAAACTVYSSDTNSQTNMRLQGNLNWAAQVGFNLTLAHDGLQWRETHRTT